MQIRSAIVVFSAFPVLAAFGCHPDDEPAYELDGVPVEIDGDGPTEEEMTLTVETYRMQVALEFGISPAREIEVWRQIDEIRWTDEGIAGEGSYDPATRRLRLNWPGCAAWSALYPKLTEHYVRVLTGSDDASEHKEWALALARNTAEILCD